MQCVLIKMIIMLYLLINTSIISHTIVPAVCPIICKNCRTPTMDILKKSTRSHDGNSQLHMVQVAKKSFKFNEQ